jgi:hypothetical protein
MQKRFSIKILGQATHILGIQIQQTSKGISITQMAYIQCTLEEMGMTDCRPSNLPATGKDISIAVKDSRNAELVNSTHFKHIIGKLMYAATGTRPDIVFAVGFLGRYAHDPTTHHLKMVKILLRYLALTATASLFYPTTNRKFEFVAYSDSDWTGASDSRSTTGFVTLVNGTALTWGSKKQSLIAMSTAEAEYIAGSECALEIVWLRHFLEDFDQKQKGPTPLLLDNKSSIQMAINPSNHSRMKHIKLRFHKIRKLVEDLTLRLSYVPSKNQKTDVLTKVFPPRQASRCCRSPWNSVSPFGLKGSININTCNDTCALTMRNPKRKDEDDRRFIRSDMKLYKVSHLCCIHSFVLLFFIKHCIHYTTVPPIPAILI